MSLYHEKLTEYQKNNIIDEIAKRQSNYKSCNYGSDLGDVDMGRLDPLFEDAARLIVVHQQGSTSMIQRKFAIGYNRAGRIMDQLEKTGIVGPSEGRDIRHVMCVNENDLEIKLNKIDDFNIPAYNYNYFLSKYGESWIENFMIENHNLIEERTKYYIDIKEDEERRDIEIEKKKMRDDILARKRRNELKKIALKELEEEGLIDYSRKREPIKQEVKDIVWNRDGGSCVKCGSQERIEFDHIIPFSKGGSNTERNIQLLCENCNRSKSNKI